MTNGIRLELARRNTLVIGVVLGAADTDIMAGTDCDGPLTDPADVTHAGLDGVEKGLIEVIVDEWSAHVKASPAADPAEFYQQLLAIRSVPRPAPIPPPPTRKPEGEKP
ncbi:hypothetical protein [Streptomyces sp. cmx-4-25]|uniref:hypothetical protein n=1 Tax=unclassified Streptomyces TaxID=2593676 RepID=UPI003981579B